MNLDDMDREHQRREKAADNLAAWSMRLNGQAAEWDLETVKHLVVLNAAGVAGVATLLAGTGSDIRRLAWSLILFAAGVILAVINMHLASDSFDQMADEIAERVDQALDPSVPLDHHLVRRPEKGRKLNSWGIRVGWGSGICAVLATGWLTYLLLTKQ